MSTLKCHHAHGKKVSRHKLFSLEKYLYALKQGGSVSSKRQGIKIKKGNKENVTLVFQKLEEAELIEAKQRRQLGFFSKVIH